MSSLLLTSSVAPDVRPEDGIAAAGAFMATGLLVTATRFYIRFTRRGKVGADDWLSLVGLVTLIGCGVTLIIGTYMQILGYTTTPDKMTWAVKFEYAFLPLQTLSIGLCKLSFIFFYRRVFVIKRKRGKFHILTIVAVFIVAGWTTACTMQYLFQCGPYFTEDWAPHEESIKHCDAGLIAENATAISDFLTDLIVFILPIPMVLRLQMNMSQKLLVLLIFTLGAVAIAASIFRMIVFIEVVSVSFTQGSDRDLLITRLLYWAMLEAGLALIACCLPPLSALFQTKAATSAAQSLKRKFSITPSDTLPHSTSSRPLMDVESQADTSRHLSRASPVHLPPVHIRDSDIFDTRIVLNHHLQQPSYQDEEEEEEEEVSTRMTLEAGYKFRAFPLIP